MNDGTRNPRINPWASDSPDAVRVTAVDDQGRLLPASNHGVWVDIGAPGTASSNAAPRAAAAAAEVLAAHPRVDPAPGSRSAAARLPCDCRARRRLALRPRPEGAVKAANANVADLRPRRRAKPVTGAGTVTGGGDRVRPVLRRPAGRRHARDPQGRASAGKPLPPLARRLPRDSAGLRAAHRRADEDDRLLRPVSSSRCRVWSFWAEARRVSTSAARCGGSTRTSPITLVESTLVGGECTYFACMPSKTLLRAPELREAATRTPGVDGGTARPRRRSSAGATGSPRTGTTPDRSSGSTANASSSCAAQGASCGRESSRWTGSELEYDRLVVATGSSPVSPPVEGLEERRRRGTTDDATSSHEVPASLIVMGGGVAGCELAQLYRRLGSRGDDRPARRPADAARRRRGGRGARRRRSRRRASGFGSGSRRAGSGVKADPGVSVELAAARRSRPSGCSSPPGGSRTAKGSGSSSSGSRISSAGIEVDEHLRAAENVWAIGDCTGIALFTHVGKYQARVAAAEHRGPRRAQADYRAIPAVAFTDPQIATVGTTEGEGLVSARWDVESTSRASTYERPKRHGFVKVVADPKRRVLVGAVAVGPEAGEWCQQLTLADSRRGADRRPARRDPALPDLLRGRASGPSRSCRCDAIERIVVASTARRPPAARSPGRRRWPGATRRS